MANTPVSVCPEQPQEYCKKRHIFPIVFPLLNERETQAYTAEGNISTHDTETG